MRQVPSAGVAAMVGRVVGDVVVHDKWRHAHEPHNFVHRILGANPGAYISAESGSIFVEFNVPLAAIYPASRPDWRQIPAAYSDTGKRFTKLGRPPMCPVPATNIEVVAAK